MVKNQLCVPMLDLAKLAGQLPQISQHLQLEAKASRQRLELAQRLLTRAETAAD
ncbi:MAG: hypothetical protein HC838_11935 [Spirulinaceae cyanobacterium RM2_2_10]|nr:hypothetical protein [Spirulinaceae cyanobacterium RM2_2_10]